MVTLVASIDVGRIPYAAFSRGRAQCSFARGGRGKALSIVARRDSQYSEERTTHLLFAREAATFSNRFDSVVRFLKPATRCVNSNRFHRLRGGAAAPLIHAGHDACFIILRSEHSERLEG